MRDRELDALVAEKVMGWTEIAPNCLGPSVPGGYPLLKRGAAASHPTLL